MGYTLAWIKSSSMPPASVTVIPGNHDAYTSDVVKREPLNSYLLPTKPGISTGNRTTRLFNCAAMLHLSE